MDKMTVLDYIRRHGIIAIIRADSGEDLVRVVEAVAEGGIRCIEVTMTTPGALRCLELAAVRLSATDICLGVGSVLDAETARLAILAGARYVVSPVLAPGVIETAHRYGCPCLPGAFTPTEIFTAWEAGADMVKVFPASLGGLDYIKAVRAPLPNIPLVPTGGVDLNNLAAFVAAGVSAIGVGGNLAGKDLIKAGRFAEITENARKYATALAVARNALA